PERPGRSARGCGRGCGTGRATSGSAEVSAPSMRLGSRFPGIGDDAVKQLFQVLVVALHAAQDQAVVVGQGEERTRRPLRRYADAKLAVPILLDNLSAFKAQVFEEAGRVALNL